MSRSWGVVRAELNSIGARLAGCAAVWKDDDRLPFAIRTTCQELYDRDTELRAEMDAAIAIERAQTIARYSR